MKEKEASILNRGNRFLIGLIVALSFALFAFEWTTVTTSEHPIFGDPIVHQEDPELLPQIIYRKEAPLPSTPKNGPDMTIVKEIERRNPELVKTETHPSLKNPLDFDPTDFMEEEELPFETHPKVDFKKVELFPHTNACIGLTGKEMENCSQEEIVKLIKNRIHIPSILFDIGKRQGVLVKFIVGKDGYIHEVEILQQTHPALATEAIKTLQNLPKLNPAIQNGMPVSMQMEVPIVLDIRE